ncbi:uncharacterized protein BYT42DRAFT_475679, partial [Radiomyces spectabilis]|uniref:uncharacterized protein n=1 Tax=Radiomyces spectabilis TaxID=64574 RepID=UPI00221F0A0B
LPILIAFAAVGVLSIFSFIFCMIYRCATQKKLRHNDDPDQYPFPQLSQKPESDAANPGRSMSRILPWLMIKSPNNERMESERDAHINGGNKTEIVTSSLPGTFVPMHTSPLTLVPRHEIMGDPSRRRGVDEVDMWEQRQQQLRRPPMWQFNGDFPDSPPLAQLHETS